MRGGQGSVDLLRRGCPGRGRVWSVKVGHGGLGAMVAAAGPFNQGAKQMHDLVATDLAARSQIPFPFRTPCISESNLPLFLPDPCLFHFLAPWRQRVAHRERGIEEGARAGKGGTPSRITPASLGALFSASCSLDARPSDIRPHSKYKSHPSFLSFWLTRNVVGTCGDSASLP
jgi:hypothetical protein